MSVPQRGVVVLLRFRLAQRGALDISDFVRLRGGRHHRHPTPQWETRATEDPEKFEAAAGSIINKNFILHVILQCREGRAPHRAVRGPRPRARPSVTSQQRSGGQALLVNTAGPARCRTTCPPPRRRGDESGTGSVPAPEPGVPFQVPGRLGGGHVVRHRTGPAVLTESLGRDLGSEVTLGRALGLAPEAHGAAHGYFLHCRMTWRSAITLIMEPAAASNFSGSSAATVSHCGVGMAVMSTTSKSIESLMSMRPLRQSESK